MNLKKNHNAGFTLVEIMIVVAIIGMLAAIAVPNLVRARRSAQTNSCINNLRLIDSAKTQWALETGHSTGDTPLSTDLQTYIGRGNGRFPVCPLSPGGTPAYVINIVGVVPLCPNTNSDHPAMIQ